MTGYAPLFDSLTTGTLCGKWPDIGLWPIVLAMANKHGVLDVTPTYISSVTGLVVEEVSACMARFCEPDPYSRTATEDGRRLMLLEPDRRAWGWRIVNHGLYRERARLLAKSQREVASGQNAGRMSDRRGPPETAETVNGPPATASDRPSDANADSYAGEDRSPTEFARFWEAYPKKRKRKTAEEIWNRKHLDDRVEELLADILERSKSDQRWLEGYIPDPTTYLNGERWNDEKEPPKRQELRRELPDALDVARRTHGG
jgi:hypothetical protein